MRKKDSAALSANAWHPLLPHSPGSNLTVVNQHPMAKQLALGITLRKHADLETFVAGGNHQAVSDLTTCARGKGEPFVYLWGGEGVGKSHLLQAACQLADEEQRSAAYIPLQQASEFHPDILSGLDSLQLICLDDIQQVAGSADWEQAIFHLFNRLRDRDASLLVSATQSPSALPLRLPDLASRMNWGLCYQLQPLSDEEKQLALTSGAARRGLEMSNDTAAYILRHTPRDMESLQNLLDRLDHASLEAQRRLTTPFVRSFLTASRD
ncbi:MAG: DnaA regulatory inactivator Hda [Sedimenticola sp.]